LKDIGLKGIWGSQRGNIGAGASCALSSWREVNLGTFSCDEVEGRDRINPARRRGSHEKRGDDAFLGTSGGRHHNARIYSVKARGRQLYRSGSAYWRNLRRPGSTNGRESAANWEDVTGGES